MKKKKILIIILVVLGVLIITAGIVLISQTTSDNKNDTSRVPEKIKNLLEDDYNISRAIYGSVDVKEVPNVKINDVTYKLVSDDALTGNDSLQELISRTYIDNLFEESMVNINKYNQYVEIEKKLYVNINSKCDIDKFDDNITIEEETNDEIAVKTNKRTVIINKNGNVYKLEDSAYNCK